MATTPQKDAQASSWKEKLKATFADFSSKESEATQSESDFLAEVQGIVNKELNKRKKATATAWPSDGDNPATTPCSNANGVVVNANFDNDSSDEAAEELLREPLDEYGFTALHFACWYKATPVAVIRWLIKTCPAALTIPDALLTRTPLHWACDSKANVEAVRVLFEYEPEKASSSRIIPTRQVDRRGWNPLHMACVFLAPLPLIETLLEQDAAAASKELPDDTVPPCLHMQDKEGNTPLHHARHLSVIEYLANASPATLLICNKQSRRRLFARGEGGRRGTTEAVGRAALVNDLPGLIPFEVAQLSLGASIPARLDPAAAMLSQKTTAAVQALMDTVDLQERQLVADLPKDIVNMATSGAWTAGHSSKASPLTASMPCKRKRQEGDGHDEGEGAQRWYPLAPSLRASLPDLQVFLRENIGIITVLRDVFLMNQTSIQLGSRATKRHCSGLRCSSSLETTEHTERLVSVRSHLNGLWIQLRSTDPSLLSCGGKLNRRRLITSSKLKRTEFAVTARQA